VAKLWSVGAAFAAVVDTRRAATADVDSMADDGAAGGEGGRMDGGVASLPAELGQVGAATECRGGAPWHPPAGGVDLGLRVNNTLTAGAGACSIRPACRTTTSSWCHPTWLHTMFGCAQAKRQPVPFFFYATSSFTRSCDVKCPPTISGLGTVPSLAASRVRGRDERVCRHSCRWAAVRCTRRRGSPAV